MQSPEKCFIGLDVGRSSLVHCKVNIHLNLYKYVFHITILMRWEDAIGMKNNTFQSILDISKVIEETSRYASVRNFNCNYEKKQLNSRQDA